MIYLWVSGLGGLFFDVRIEHLGVKILGLLLIPLLSFALPRLMTFVSTGSTFLIYGTHYSDPSYENRFYQDDMNRVKRLVREGRLHEAIWAYREIIQKAPKMYEARFNLAQVYRMAGQLGLAAHEYDKLRNLRDELGPNHVFVLESERAIAEMKGMFSKKDGCEKELSRTDMELSV
jgi:hypothetical protein